MCFFATHNLFFGKVEATIKRGRKELLCTVYMGADSSQRNLASSSTPANASEALKARPAKRRKPTQHRLGPPILAYTLHQLQIPTT